MHLSILILHQDAHWFASATGIQIRYNLGKGRLPVKDQTFYGFLDALASLEMELMLTNP